jgi:hypothetical protein
MIREIRIQDAGGHAAVEPRSRDDYGPKGMDLEDHPMADNHGYAPLSGMIL